MPGVGPGLEILPVPPSAAPKLSAHPRLQVQRNASSTERRHFFRAVRRIGALVILDLTALEGLREFLGILRGGSPTLSALFPGDFMGGWGSIGAVVVGLVVTGGYASQDAWASPRVVMRGVAFGAAMAMWQSIDTLGVLWMGLRWVAVAASVGLVLGSARATLGLAVYRYRERSTPGDRVLLVGDPDGEDGRQAAEAVYRRPGMRSVGWLSEQVHLADYLGHPSAVWEVLCETNTDTVVLCDTLSPGLFDTVVEAAAVAGCKVLSVRNRATLMATQPRALKDSNIRMLELTFPAGRAGQAVVKRMFDYAVSSILILLLSPLLLLIALWIRLDSPGPALFVQDRVGQAGRVFRMMKFRTMRNGADRDKIRLAHLNASGDPRLFKIPDDPRSSAAGVWTSCRRSSTCSREKCLSWDRAPSSSRTSRSTTTITSSDSR